LSGDPDLLIQAASGDSQAFEVLVLRHREAVWRFARSLTRDAAAAEDALQEAFLAAWRSAASFRGEGSALGWLLAITRHAVYRQYRSRAGEPEHLESLAELGEAAGWGADPDPLEALVAQDEVRRALARMALEDRELLLLREVEGLSNEACADLLGIGLPALKSRLHRARLRFVSNFRRERHGH
jgi:RNA polymerase sigma-70 factor (ECF subfamily)